MDSEVVKRLHSQAAFLAAKFEQGDRETTAYIDEAIALDREALSYSPSGHYERSSSLTWLATHLSTRYDQFGTMDDLQEATALHREALSLLAQGHSDRSRYLNALATCLTTRYYQLGNMQDLEEAILLNQEALSLFQDDDPGRSASLNILATDLSARYDELGVMQDLEEAIVLFREGLLLHPKGCSDRSTFLNNLAVLLSIRYDRLGAMADLDEAIVLDQEALSLRPKGHADRSTSLNNLAVRFSVRYNQLGTSEDLEEALVLNRESLSLLPQGHPGRSASLNTLAICLSTRYNQLGVMQDLEEAIVLDREALALRPQGHPDRSMSLNNLAISLTTRYNQLGIMQDLDEAISLDREALSLRPQGHPHRSMSLNNLAIGLSTRYGELRTMQDIEDVVVLFREALSFHQEGHPNRSISLNNLACSLSSRFRQLGSMGDLEEAIALHREALSLRPQGHPQRAMSLNNLAISLSTWYDQFGTMHDLEEAIILSSEALSLCPPGRPDRSTAVICLATFFSTRYQHVSDPSTVEEPFPIYAQLADMPPTVPALTLTASRVWIRAAENYKHSSMLLAYEVSLRLLVEHLSLLPIAPQHLDILKKHTSSLAVDAFSACLRYGSPKHAVELLEQGRGVFWNQLTRLRSPLDDVIASGSAGETLASEFMRLSFLIRKTLDSPGIEQHDRLCRHNLEMQKVVTAIRKLPGFSRFLLPLLFSDLRCAASAGPVIIVNASHYGCDALIILDDRDPVHIPLSITKQYVQHLSTTIQTMTARPATMGATNALGRILRELWNDVVSPVIHFLQMTCPLQSRIWWCPTAEFSTLPLHAAGPYRKGQQNLATLYVSSYTPTLSALIHARRPHSLNSASNLKRFVGIGQANAAGQIELPSVSSELANIGQYVNKVAAFTRIEGSESCASRVAEELGKNEWAHFACHGLANRKEPFESAFALSDGEFTIERIIRCNLEDPEFAYLSACHTTVGDEESPDEMIHLASAMQFIGFRSVIGTMWAVDDGETNKITSMFYSLMLDENGCLDHTRAAFALNKTMRTINVPLDQRVLYVHIGA